MCVLNQPGRVVNELTDRMKRIEQRKRLEGGEDRNKGREEERVQDR